MIKIQHLNHNELENLKSINLECEDNFKIDFETINIITQHLSTSFGVIFLDYINWNCWRHD